MTLPPGFPADVALQLFLAVVLGGVIGLEREFKRKEAGLRTYALVALGATLFTVAGMNIVEMFGAQPGVRIDPVRVVEAVAAGIGFVGAGIIIYRHFHVEGLTTAAGLWLVGAIGVTLGAGMYWAAVLATLSALLVLAGLHEIERMIFEKSIVPRRRNADVYTSETDNNL